MNGGGDAVAVWVRGGADPGVFASLRSSGTVDWPRPQRVSTPCPALARRGCSFAGARVAIDDGGDVVAAWVSDVGSGSGPG
ncbi:MAG: hypothetical protein QOK40_2581, partial [Miltoncostaeaceae bacterium]|nr:hypothetical protein [Miltoncostaeaceae bacterium]